MYKIESRIISKKKIIPLKKKLIKKIIRDKKEG